MGDEFMKENRKPYTDVSSVESQRNDLTFEEFPDGPYGSPVNSDTLGKSTPWRIDQRTGNPFDYENHQLHEGIQRDYPGEDVFDDTIPDSVEEPRE